MVCTFVTNVISFYIQHLCKKLKYSSMGQIVSWSKMA